MRQINFHDLLIFTAADPRPEAGSTPIIVVLAVSTPLVDGAPTGKRRTTLAYIGPLTEFHHQYAAHMARLFDRQDALHENQHLREGGFLRYLNQQIERSQPLSPFTLSRRGIQAYAWGEDDAKALGVELQGNTIDDGVGIQDLVVFPLDDADDMHRMIGESLALKELAHKAGVRKTLWIGRPLPASRDDAKQRAA